MHREELFVARREAALAAQVPSDAEVCAFVLRMADLSLVFVGSKENEGGRGVYVVSRDEIILPEGRWTVVLSVRMCLVRLRWE